MVIAWTVLSVAWVMNAISSVGRFLSAELVADEPSDPRLWKYLD